MCGSTPDVRVLDPMEASPKDIIDDGFDRFMIVR